MRTYIQNGAMHYVYSQEDRAAAREVSLTALASSMGFNPVRSGEHYILKEMDSLVIYDDSSWKRWSGRGEITAGSQIDFLMAFGNVSSAGEAIYRLLQFKGKNPDAVPAVDMDKYNGAKQAASRELRLPEKNKDYRRAFAYLIKTRGLSQEIVSYFVHNKLLYEDAEHHNLVFLGRDPEGTVRYAVLRGTADAYGKKFKMDASGSDKHYGVNIVNPESRTVKVFESSIDLMSYMDMKKDYRSNKLVLGGVAHNPLIRFLNDYRHIDEIVFCLDNDKAARNVLYGEENNKGYIEMYEEHGYKVSVDVPVYGKDFNEDLVYMKDNNIDPAEVEAPTAAYIHRGR